MTTMPIPLFLQGTVGSYLLKHAAAETDKLNHAPPAFDHGIKTAHVTIL
jgi:hypothetical protein